MYRRYRTGVYREAKACGASSIAVVLYVHIRCHALRTIRLGVLYTSQDVTWHNELYQKLSCCGGRVEEMRFLLSANSACGGRTFKCVYIYI